MKPVKGTAARLAIATQTASRCGISRTPRRGDHARATSSLLPPARAPTVALSIADRSRHERDRHGGPDGVIAYVGNRKPAPAPSECWIVAKAAAEPEAAGSQKRSSGQGRGCALRAPGWVVRAASSPSCASRSLAREVVLVRSGNATSASVGARSLRERRSLNSRPLARWRRGTAWSRSRARATHRDCRSSTTRASGTAKAVPVASVRFGPKRSSTAAIRVGYARRFRIRATRRTRLPLDEH